MNAFQRLKKWFLEPAPAVIIRSAEGGNAPIPGQTAADKRKWVVESQKAREQ